MPTFKTIRGEVLNTDNCHRFKATPSLKRLALAASDYRSAVKSPEFAAYYGGIEAFQHDLFLFVEQWYHDMERQAARTENRKKARAKARARIAVTAPKSL